MREIIRTISSRLFVVSLVTSFFVSLLFLTGRFDQDFFSFYYIGRGVTEGMHMYMDFAHNKGPVLYTFFAFLNLIFRSNYRLAAIFASTLLDTISIYFLFQLMKSWFGYRFPRNKIKSFIIVVLSVLYLKSFSMGGSSGGVYSETIALALLAPSLYVLEKRPLVSGVLFSLSVLSRPTLLFFMAVYLLKLYLGNRSLRDVMRFLGGFLLTPALLFLVFLFDGSLYYVMKNVYYYNFNYANTVRDTYLTQLLATVTNRLRILLSIVIFIVLSVLYYLTGRDSKRQKALVLVLSVVSLGSTFVGGYFYYHHFVQFSFAFFVIIFLAINKTILSRNKISVYVAGLPLVVSFIIPFYGFTLTKPHSPALDEFLRTKVVSNDQKKYWAVVPFYPKLYIDFDKRSPDRYYSTFFLSDYYNEGGYFDKNLHKNISKEKLKNTYFLFINKSKRDENMIIEYKADYSNIFKLKFVDSYSDEFAEVEVYESTI